MMQNSRSPLGAAFAGLAEPAVLALGVTQTIGYGTLYYAFGVMAPAIAADLATGTDVLFAIFTVALLAGGFIAPAIGRALDRHGAGRVMAAGSVAAAAALLGAGLAQNLASFAMAVVAMECVSSLVLYDAAFTALAQRHGQGARARITAITLIAGFASTIFWPMTQAMVSGWGWRETFFAFAGLHLLACAPIHLALMRHAARARSAQAAAPPVPETPGLPEAERPRAFALLVVSIVLSGFVFAAISMHMVAVVAHEGFDPQTAALMAMALGPAQVLARMIDVVAGRRVSPLATGHVSLGALTVSLLLLLSAQGSAVAAVLFCAVNGVAQGLITVVRGTVPLFLFGTRGYGALLGRITGIRITVTAASPFAFAFVTGRWGMDTALGVLLACAIAAHAAWFALRRPAG
jgi:MFS family permease